VEREVYLESIADRYEALYFSLVDGTFQGQKNIEEVVVEGLPRRR
jgi:hypothetical protein